VYDIVTAPFVLLRQFSASVVAVAVGAVNVAISTVVLSAPTATTVVTVAVVVVVAVAAVVFVMRAGPSAHL
jgi:hypothetical protein